MAQKRLERIKMYGFLYSKKKNIGAGCYYCGDPVTCHDHVPPISVVEDINIEEYIKQGGTFYLYPSCTECNLALGSVQLVDVSDRVLHLITRFTKKAEKITAWDESEIKKVKGNLKAFIKSRQYEKNRLNYKIKCLHDTLSKIE